MNPSVHDIQPLLTGFALAGVAALAMVALRNRYVRGRMVFTLCVVAALTALHFAGDFHLLGAFTKRGPLEELLAALAAINTAVALLLNPWFSDRVPDRAPAIVQDALVIGIFLLVGMFLYQQDAQVFATSAIAAAVLGFALQETLGNAFAGLAIQSEKPFRVGHWIAVANYEGRVTEVTWRATKIRTKFGNLVVLPNNVIAREAITNYTEPVAPSRLIVDVGAAYGAAPNEVRAAMLTAVRSAALVLESPKPEILVQDFGGSSIVYRAWFWIDDYEDEDIARDEVRRAIYYEFARRGIEIPYPIQIEYSREETVEPRESRVDRAAAIIDRVPVLMALPLEGRRALAEAATEHVYGDREVIVREGEPGASMFVVCRGEVVVTVGPTRHEVARTKAGGYFGEMSLLTGDPRSATVSAHGDCTVLEIGVGAFKEYVTGHPEVIDHIAEAAALRRRELDESRAAAAAATVEARLTLADRMRRFFGLK